VFFYLITTVKIAIIGYKRTAILLKKHFRVYYEHPGKLTDMLVLLFI